MYRSALLVLLCIFDATDPDDQPGTEVINEQ
jgi:hypothetical protein